MKALLWVFHYIFWSELYDVTTSRNNFRLLLEHSDDSGDTKYDSSKFNQIQTFVYGSTRESNAVFFWNEMLSLSPSWDSIFAWRKSGPGSHFSNERAMTSLLSAMAINGETRYLVDSRSMLSVSPVSKCKAAHSLATTYVASIIAGSTQSIANARTLKQLIAEAISQDLSLHETLDNGISPLLYLLRAEPSLSLRGRKCYEVQKDIAKVLHVWLNLLESIGIDLTAYGQEERRLFQLLRHVNGCDRSWDWWHQLGADLFGFSYGAAISDWRMFWVHPGDQYAGQFWRMVESDSFGEKEAGCCLQHVPGSWIENE